MSYETKGALNETKREREAHVVTSVLFCIYFNFD